MLMSKRVLSIGAILAVLLLAAMVILLLVDAITADEFRNTFPRLLGVLLVAILAVWLATRIGRLAKKG